MTKDNSKKESKLKWQEYFKSSFFHFFYYGWSVAIQRVEGNYLIPDHLAESTYRLQRFPRTLTIAPRFHLKSTLTEAYVGWKLLRMEHNYNEFTYMGYTAGLSAYHTKKIKRYVRALPQLYHGYVDCTDSDSLINYMHSGKFFSCEPEGILSAKRGKHPHEMICDDILRDPDNVMNITVLTKITRTFFEELEQMPKVAMHVVGTPQDDADLFSQLEKTPTYNCKRYQTPISWDKGTVLWDKLYPIEKLRLIKQTIGEKAFNKEFMCKPVRGEEAYIDPDKYDELVDKDLQNYKITDILEVKNGAFGGFDIGKKTHPSHFAVFTERDGELIQLHSKWLDGWDYIDQIAYIKHAIKTFNIQRLCYDDTRSEFAGFQEQGLLPPEMDGINFTQKSKFAMATEFDKVITNKKIKFLHDPRQRSQTLGVDCDLRAVETNEGHGDSFFSICLALQAWRQGQGLMIWDL